MKKIVITGFAAVLSFGVLLGAPAAHADDPVGFGGITGWQPAPTVCGKTNYVPVVVTNATNQDQTGSVTVPYGTATQIGLYTSENAVYLSTLGLNLNGECPNMTYQSPADAFSQNFTVPAGQTSVYWLAAGGLDENLIGDSTNIGFGGLPANTVFFEHPLNLDRLTGFIEAHAQLYLPALNRKLHGVSGILGSRQAEPS